MKLPERNWENFLLLSVLLIFCALLIGGGMFFWHQWNHSSSHTHIAVSSDEKEDVSTIENTSKEEKKVLEEELSSLLGGNDAQYSVYVLFPSWSTPLVKNDRQQSSASVIKIFILSTAYEMAEQGKLNLEEKIRVRRKDMVGGAGVLNSRAGEPVLSIRELLQLMITESDNTATNVLIDRLTFACIQDYCDTNGFTDTVLRRKIDRKSTRLNSSHP